MNTTFRGWSSTLAARVRLVISRLVLIFALPLDFHGRVRVVRSMLSMGLKPLCLHLKACGSFGPLSVGWCGLVVSLWLVLELCLACWMGPLVVILLFVQFGFGFVCFFVILLFGPRRLVWFTDFWRWMGEGCPGHGPIQLLSVSAAEIGVRLDPDALAWSRPGFTAAKQFGWPSSAFQGCNS